VNRSTAADSRQELELLARGLSRATLAQAQPAMENDILLSLPTSTSIARDLGPLFRMCSICAGNFRGQSQTKRERSSCRMARLNVSAAFPTSRIRLAPAVAWGPLGVSAAMINLGRHAVLLMLRRTVAEAAHPTQASSAAEAGPWP